MYLYTPLSSSIRVYIYIYIDIQTNRCHDPSLQRKHGASKGARPCGVLSILARSGSQNLGKISGEIRKWDVSDVSEKNRGAPPVLIIGISHEINQPWVPPMTMETSKNTLLWQMAMANDERSGFWGKFQTKPGSQKVFIFDPVPESL